MPLTIQFFLVLIVGLMAGAAWHSAVTDQHQHKWSVPKPKGEEAIVLSVLNGLKIHIDKRLAGQNNVVSGIEKKLWAIQQHLGIAVPEKKGD